MPLSARKIKKLATQVAGKELEAQEAQFEARYQAMLDSYQEARQDYYAMQRECRWQTKVVVAKQHVIEVLLPYYPHPLSPELKHKIDLF